MIYDGPGAQTYPVAVQKSDGYIHLMFRDTGNGGAQIGQVWSADQGYTWTGFSIFSYDPGNPRQFTFLGSQGGQNLTAQATIQGRMHHWQSWNNGITWDGPYQTSPTNPGGDGEFSVGCQGPIFTFTGSFSFRAKRYSWGGGCW